MSIFMYVRFALVAFFGLCAAILAYSGHGGWGWFLLVSFLAIPYNEDVSKDDKTNSNKLNDM